MGPRLKRSFKEIKNGKYIKQRRELQLIMDNLELKRKIKSYEDFFKKQWNIISLDGGSLNDEEEQSMKKLLFNAQRKQQERRESGRLTLRDLINRSDNEEEYKTPQKPRDVYMTPQKK